MVGSVVLTVTEEHDQGCWFARPRDDNGNILPHSDPAKRLSDTYMLHRIANPDHSVGKWFAVRLNDGTGDGVLYDTRRECIRHQRHAARWCAYIRIEPCGMSVCEAETFLRSSRQAVESTGELMSDPDREIIPPLTSEDYLRRAADQAIGHPTIPYVIGKRL
jgi:hypothetical protein